MRNNVLNHNYLCFQINIFKTDAEKQVEEGKSQANEALFSELAKISISTSPNHISLQKLTRCECKLQNSFHEHNIFFFYPMSNIQLNLQFQNLNMSQGCLRCSNLAETIARRRTTMTPRKNKFSSTFFLLPFLEIFLLLSQSKF